MRSVRRCWRRTGGSDEPLPPQARAQPHREGTPRPTNAQAQAGGARGTVYATANAWARGILVDALLSRIDQITAQDGAADCAAWRALTQAQRNAACSAVGRPNGCNLGCSRTAP